MSTEIYFCSNKLKDGRALHSKGLVRVLHGIFLIGSLVKVKIKTYILFNEKLIKEFKKSIYFEILETFHKLGQLFESTSNDLLVSQKFK